MKKRKSYLIVWLFSVIFLMGCATIATQTTNEEGKIITLTLNHSGKAKFDNGAEIESSPSLLKAIKGILTQIASGASKAVSFVNR